LPSQGNSRREETSITMKKPATQKRKIRGAEAKDFKANSITFCCCRRRIFFLSILFCIYWEFANEVRLKIKSHAKRSSKVPRNWNGNGHGVVRRGLPRVWGSWESVFHFDIFFRRKIEMRFITLWALGFVICPFIALRVGNAKNKQTLLIMAIRHSNWHTYVYGTLISVSSKFGWGTS